MNTVNFGTINSHTDLSSILGSKVIGTPTPKTETVQVAGRDGVLDLTEYFGEVKYSNRKLTFEFTLLTDRAQYNSAFSDIQDKLHGQRMKIVLSDDPDFYYIGRLAVSGKKVERGVCTFTVEADCEPYKYKQAVTIKTQAITTSGTITCSNLRRRVVPKITTDAAIQVAFGGNTYAFGIGSFSNTGIVFEQGDNILAITGTANVTVTYQEARL